MVIDRIQRGERVGINVGQACRGAFGIHMNKVGRASNAVNGINYATIFQRHGLSDIAARRQARNFTFQVHSEKRGLQNILRGDEKAFAVGGPCKRAHRTVPCVGERDDLAALQIHQLDDQPVGLISCARHRCPCQIFAIGGCGGRGVHAGVVGGQVDWVGRAQCRAVNIKIGRLCLMRIGMA